MEINNFKGGYTYKLESTLADGAIYKMEGVIPVHEDGDQEFIGALGQALNQWMRQMGFSAYKKDIIPLVSITDDELPQVIDFINSIREEGDECSLQYVE